VPLANLDLYERKEIIFYDSPLLMVIFLAALIANLRSILRSRAALELENLDLRHQIGVLQRSTRKRPKLTALDRLLWVCCPASGATGAHDWLSFDPRRSSLGIGKVFVLSGQGPSRPARETRSSARSPRPDPQDEPRQPRLGRTTHPR
jgi:hypothetical protein